MEGHEEKKDVHEDKQKAQEKREETIEKYRHAPESHNLGLWLGGIQVFLLMI